MAIEKDRLGAQSLDGIDARIGFKFLDANRTLLMLPLQGEDCPTDVDEIMVSGPPTYTLTGMFKAMKPSVEVTLETGNAANPVEDAEITFQSIKNFEPDDIMQSLPLLRALKDKQSLLSRLENLLQETSFQKMMKDKTKKAALVNFLRAVVADIEAAQPE